jgi:hypothetical protein
MLMVDDLIKDYDAVFASLGCPDWNDNAPVHHLYDAVTSPCQVKIVGDNQKCGAIFQVHLSHHVKHSIR